MDCSGCSATLSVLSAIKFRWSAAALESGRRLGKMTEDQVSSGEFADLRPNPKVYLDSRVSVDSYSFSSSFQNLDAAPPDASRQGRWGWS